MGWIWLLRIICWIQMKVWDRNTDPDAKQICCPCCGHVTPRT